HVVHAIDEINICMPRPAEHHFGALRAAFGCVTRQIVRTDVCLGLHDARAIRSFADPMNENLADQARRQLDGRTSVERAAKLLWIRCICPLARYYRRGLG